jgi:5'-nucleotidase
VRADITFAPSPAGEAPGAVTFGEAFTVQPFGNTLVTLTVTGAQLKTMLEQQWALAGGAEKTNLLQVSEGFTYVADTSKPIGSRVDPASIKIAGKTVDPASSFRITVNAFLADGGDGFAVLKEGTARTAGGLDLDALLAHFAQQKKIAPPNRARVVIR